MIDANLVAARRLWRENEVAQANAQRSKRLAGGVGAIEEVHNRHQGKFAAGRFGQCVPPAATGVQRGRLTGQQGDRCPKRQHDARIHQAVHHDRRILTTDH